MSAANRASGAASSAAGAVYRLSGLQKDYNDRRVVDIDALDVHRGEILALVGPSGSGKSTLLRLINFLEPASAGTIEYLGRSYAAGEIPPLSERRRVTTVFQRPMLLDRTVWDNVAYGLRLRGERDGRERIAAALEQVGLNDLARQRARSLSGGEAQRVALARAMVIEPSVLLLDEPTANLDPYNVGLIESIIGRLNDAGSRLNDAGGPRDNAGSGLNAAGVTAVLVTHNIFQARRLAHRTAFLLDGRVVETAATEQFFSAAQDPRTRAFINGEMVY